MLKQVFRVAFVAVVWKQYKATIISTAVLFAYLCLVGSIHDDYLEHANLQKETSVNSMSFIYKWLSLAAGVLVYFGFHLIRGRLASKLKSRRGNSSKKSAHTDDDPFAEIRIREKLRGRGDFLVDKDKNDN